MDMKVFELFTSCLSFDTLCFSIICPFHLSCQIYGYRVIHSLLTVVFFFYVCEVNIKTFPSFLILVTYVFLFHIGQFVRNIINLIVLSKSQILVSLIFIYFFIIIYICSNLYYFHYFPWFEFNLLFFLQSLRWKLMLLISDFSSSRI